MKRLLPWLIPAGLCIAWFFSGKFNWVPSYLLPRPLEVAETAASYLFGTTGNGPYAGRFVGDALASGIRVGLGFLLAVGLGLPLGILSGRINWVRSLLSTPVNSLRAVPGIAWLPLAMVWFGIGLKTTIFLVAMAAFFPIYLNAAAGAAQISPLLLRAGAMMGVSRGAAVFKILIPAAMPAIMAGLRLGLGFAWAYLVLGELSGVNQGLGAVIMDARMLGRIDMIVVGIICIAVLGRSSDLVLKAGMEKCLKSAARM